jgi:hypothetical protein
VVRRRVVTGGSHSAALLAVKEEGYGRYVRRSPFERILGKRVVKRLVK